MFLGVSPAWKFTTGFSVVLETVCQACSCYGP